MTLPGNGARLRRFQTEITRDRVFDQTFVSNQDGLNAIEFSVAPLEATRSGDIRFRLSDVTDKNNPRVMRTGEVRAGALIGDRLRFAFEPITDSSSHTYAFEVAATERSGLALVATKGDAYAAGTLMVNERPRWADLMFQTSTSPPVGSPWATFWGTDDQAAPKRVTAILGLLGLNWLAVGFLLQGFVAARRGPR
ncbi:MAG TPA: hypothetical protein VGJ78_06910 [Vicinamibacterales bacterium]